MPKFVTVTLLLTQGTTPWLDAADYPVLVDGFAQDGDLDRVAVREGWV